MKKHICGVVLFASSLISMAYGESLKIGLNAELTGSIPTVGGSCLNAAQMAVNEINQAGGLEVQGLNYTLELDVRDNKDDTEEAVRITDALAQEGVFAMVGPNASRNAIPAAERAEQRSLLMISPWSTNVQTTQNKTWVFRTAFTDDFQGVVMANFAYGNLKVTKAAVMYDLGGGHNSQSAAFFQQDYEKLGGQIVAFEGYPTGTTNFSEYLTRIINSGAEALFLPNYFTETPQQVKQARSQGFTGIIIGTDAWGSPEIFSQGTDVMNGTYFSAHYAADIATAKAQEFVQRYQTLYNGTPDDVAALTYDTFGLIAAAIQEAGSVQPAAVRQALSQLPLYEGVTGKMKFEGSGTPIKNAVILQIMNGEFVYFDSAGPIGGTSYVPLAEWYR